MFCTRSLAYLLIPDKFEGTLSFPDLLQIIPGNDLLNVFVSEDEKMKPKAKGPKSTRSVNVQ